MLLTVHGSRAHFCEIRLVFKESWHVHIEPEYGRGNAHAQKHTLVCSYFSQRGCLNPFSYPLTPSLSLSLSTYTHIYGDKLLTWVEYSCLEMRLWLPLRPTPAPESIYLLFSWNLSGQSLAYIYSFWTRLRASSCAWVSKVISHDAPASPSCSVMSLSL